LNNQLKGASGSMADRLERLPVCNYHRFLFMVIALAFFFDNLDLAMMAYLLGSIQSEFGLTTAEAGMLGSESFVGMAIGAACSGLLADRFGRKPVFQVSMIIWGAASYLCSTAGDPVSLGAYRVLLGIGMGMELPLAQTLLSEFIPTKRRGKYLALMDGNWPIAFICAGLMSYYVVAAHGWRTMFLLGAIPSLFLFVVRRYIPESPRWLEARGKHAKASAVVEEIERKVKRAIKADVLPPVVVTATSHDQGPQGVRALWSPRYRNRSLTVWGLWFFALLGFYGLNTWLGALLQRSGIDVSNSILYTTYLALGGIPGFLWAAWIVERWGRKPACICTLLGGAVTAFIYGWVADSGYGFAALVSSGATMQFFMFGMWAVLYTYTPELYPTRLRASGCGMASTIGRVGSLLGPTVVGLALSVVGQPGVFMVGAGCFVIAALIVYRLGVETRGLSLEDISEKHGGAEDNLVSGEVALD
jgi:putative MFS transporter